MVITYSTFCYHCKPSKVMVATFPMKSWYAQPIAENLIEIVTGMTTSKSLCKASPQEGRCRSSWL